MQKMKTVNHSYIGFTEETILYQGMESDLPFDSDTDDEFEEEEDEYEYSEEDEEDEEPKTEHEKEVADLIKQQNNFHRETLMSTETERSSSWGNTQTINSTSNWQRNNPGWGQQSTPWGGQTQQTPPGSSYWGGSSNAASQYTPYNTTNSSQKFQIDRSKKFIFCDILDCIIETQLSGGKPGLLPRGIYDIRLRLEVWDKLRCFNPDYIITLVPRVLIPSSNGSNSWKVLIDYVMCSLSEYLRIPGSACKVMVQQVVNQSKQELMSLCLKSSKIDVKDSVMIGLESGFFGQSDRDKKTAERLGMDYVDLGMLLNYSY